MNSSVCQTVLLSRYHDIREEIFQALGVIWLPVLTSLSSPALPPLLSAPSGLPREVRSLARALCSHCRLEPNYHLPSDPLTSLPP